MEIRTSAHKRGNAADVLQQDCVEWHDRNHIPPRQRWWFRSLFILHSCDALARVYHIYAN